MCCSCNNFPKFQKNLGPSFLLSIFASSLIWFENFLKELLMFEVVYHLLNFSLVLKSLHFYQALSLSLITFEATLNRKFVQLNFPPLRRFLPCRFPPLRVTFGSASEGMIISLSTVADGICIYFPPLRMSLRFWFSSPFR